MLIKKWNYLTGPVKGDLEKKMNDKFDSIIQVIKENKKDYLKNRDKHDKKNIEIKKDLVDNFKKLMNEKHEEKNEWIKKINQIEKIKNEFIGMGPIKSSENNEIWKEFKSINKEFYLFPEYRQYPIRMIDYVPKRWIFDNKTVNGLNVEPIS